MKGVANQARREDLPPVVATKAGTPGCWTTLGQFSAEGKSGLYAVGRPRYLTMISVSEPAKTILEKTPAFDSSLQMQSAPAPATPQGSGVLVSSASQLAMGIKVYDAESHRASAPCP